jgi:hypothetical protein
MKRKEHSFEQKKIRHEKALLTEFYFATKKIRNYFCIDLINGFFGQQFGIVRGPGQDDGEFSFRNMMEFNAMFGQR